MHHKVKHGIKDLPHAIQRENGSFMRSSLRSCRIESLALKQVEEDVAKRIGDGPTKRLEAALARHAAKGLARLEKKLRTAT